MSQLPKEPTFDKWSPIYDNTYDKQAPEFGELWKKKCDFVEQMRGQFRVDTPEVPKNIAGLVPRADKKRIPTTTRFFRRMSTFERNGMFNIHTPNLNVRFLSVGFFFFLGWGWTAFQINGYNFIDQNESYEQGTIYDKLTTRQIPPVKQWHRPG